MSFIINSGITSLTTTGTYTINNSIYTNYDGTLGGSGLMYAYRRSTVTRYTSTDKFIMHNGIDYPVFVSDKGRSFIFLMSKNGVEYKKYIK